jgi:5-methyltetrahydropteroyltriglutamate--homocysteine methyltransferase
MTIWRADVPGSLLRPEYLRRARIAFEAGNLTSAEFKRIEDRAVDQAVALQEGAGVDVVTDGEMRRTLFVDPLLKAIDGLKPVPPAETLKIPFHGDRPEDEITVPITKRVENRITRTTIITVEEYAYARGQARNPVKITLPSPLALFPYWSQQRSRPTYRDPFELFIDATTILKEEVRQLAALGCRYIQIDAPDLGQLADPTRQAAFEVQGISPDRTLTEGVDLVNELANGVPEVTFALHLCKGNSRSRWMATGGYAALSKQVFTRIGNFDRVLLEYDDARSGSFEPLADMPDDKTVVLGLVSTKREPVESVEEVAARIAEAARYHPLERLAVSTQCGFASAASGNEISKSAQEAKLRTVADVAAHVWS